jgi:polyisoprenoid-binding protein YceI
MTIKQDIKKLSHLAILFCLTSFISTWAAAAEDVVFDQNSGSVEFHATGHPSAIKIVGKGKSSKGSFTVKEKTVTGSAHFDLASLDTGIETRNTHMKEKYLEIQKFPDAVLTITKMELPKDFVKDSSFTKLPFTGNLSLHGVEHAVTGLADISRHDSDVTINATFGLKIADYAIALPTFMGITMADDVQITVQSKAQVAKSDAVPTSK